MAVQTVCLWPPQRLYMHACCQAYPSCAMHTCHLLNACLQIVDLRLGEVSEMCVTYVQQCSSFLWHFNMDEFTPHSTGQLTQQHVSEPLLGHMPHSRYKYARVSCCTYKLLHLQLSGQEVITVCCTAAAGGISMDRFLVMPLQCGPICCDLCMIRRARID
jgi:hypothetical protein